MRAPLVPETPFIKFKGILGAALYLRGNDSIEVRQTRQSGSERVPARKCGKQAPEEATRCLIIPIKPWMEFVIGKQFQDFVFQAWDPKTTSNAEGEKYSNLLFELGDEKTKIEISVELTTKLVSLAKVYEVPHDEPGDQRKAFGTCIKLSAYTLIGLLWALPSLKLGLLVDDTAVRSQERQSLNCVIRGAVKLMVRLESTTAVEGKEELIDEIVKLAQTKDATQVLTYLQSSPFIQKTICDDKYSTKMKLFWEEMAIFLPRLIFHSKVTLSQSNMTSQNMQHPIQRAPQVLLFRKIFLHASEAQPQGVQEALRLKEVLQTMPEDAPLIPDWFKTCFIPWNSKGMNWMKSVKEYWDSVQGKVQSHKRRRLHNEVDAVVEEREEGEDEIVVIDEVMESIPASQPCPISSTTEEEEEEEEDIPASQPWPISSTMEDEEEEEEDIPASQACPISCTKEDNEKGKKVSSDQI